jgi:hypothetical protein
MDNSFSWLFSVVFLKLVQERGMVVSVDENRTPTYWAG